jgi:antitoxin component of RelBE/YafQ-DinJ toxin-antitoxin module
MKTIKIDNQTYHLIDAVSLQKGINKSEVVRMFLMDNIKDGIKNEQANSQ